MYGVLLLLYVVSSVSGAYIYSSFYAPLWEPRVLQYRVDARFAPGAARGAAHDYRRRYGYRGERLVADLGNGRGPPLQTYDKSYGDVKFYYTYPGAHGYNQIQ